MPEASVALIGRTVRGKYRLIEVLSVGGMGVVYRASHLSYGGFVAVKVLTSTPKVDPHFVVRFRREAQFAFCLDHPNLVRVFECGEEPDGLLFIAMELLEGADLLSVAKRRDTLSHRQIVEFLSQVLAGLAFIHAAGIVHSDLKPKSILVMPLKDDEGKITEVVKLCDLGLAKVMHAPISHPSSQDTTFELTSIGAPEFRSPEQAQGSMPDARSDLYSVGVMLYLLLTGRLPFEATSRDDLLKMQINYMPRPPSEWVPILDPALEEVCLRALKKDRTDRFTSAREMRRALRNTLPATPMESAQPVAPLSFHDGAVVTRGTRPARDLKGETQKPELTLPVAWWLVWPSYRI